MHNMYVNKKKKTLSVGFLIIRIGQILNWSIYYYNQSSFHITTWVKKKLIFSSEMDWAGEVFIKHFYLHISILRVYIIFWFQTFLQRSDVKEALDAVMHGRSGQSVVVMTMHIESGAPEREILLFSHNEEELKKVKWK